MISAAGFGGRVRAIVLDAGAVIEELRQAHDTEPAVTAALGRTALGAMLFAAQLKKDDQVVTVRFDGDGAAGTVLATATGSGTVTPAATRRRWTAAVVPSRRATWRSAPQSIPAASARSADPSSAMPSPAPARRK